MAHRLTDWKRILSGSPAVLRLKDAHLVPWRRWPGTGAGPGPESCPPPAVPPEELRQRLADNRELVAVSARHLAWANALLARVPHVVHLLDRDGIVLCARGSEPLADAVGLLPGRDWSERSAGSNGAGTALACGRPAAAVGPGEWGGPGDDWTCAGAPIYDPSGVSLGAIGVGTPVSHGAPERLALAAYLARAIGQEVILCQGGLVTSARPATGDLSALVAEVAAMHTEVEARAHERWVGKKRPADSRERDWKEAEAELQQVRGITSRVADAEAKIADRDRVLRLRAAERGVTRALASAAALEDTVPACLRAVCEALGWELGVFWRPDSRADVLRFAGSWRAPGAGLGEFEEAARRATFAPGAGVPGRAWAREHSTWSPKLSEVADSPLAPASGPAGLHRSFCFPVIDGGAFLGALQFFSRRPQGSDDEELPVMMANVCSQVVQFVRRREAEQALHGQQEERRLARQIQQGFLPRQAPALEGFSLAGRSRPAEAVGGDYFDFFPLAGGGLGVAVGDVSGHGVGAALLMGQARACLRALALTQADPGALLALTNGRLAEDMEPDCFVTLFLGRLDPRARSLAYSSAGHWPGYVLDRRGALKAALPSTGLPLGVSPGAEFPSPPALALGPGDLVLLLTDGVVEAFAPGGGVFGSDRALEVARRHRHEPPDAVAAALLGAVREFSGPAQADDQTVVVIRAE